MKMAKTPTEKSLGKLTEEQKHYCRNLSVIISRCKVTERNLTYSNACGKLSGYLDCLHSIAGLTDITEEDVHNLLEYYTSADRSIEE